MEEIENKLTSNNPIIVSGVISKLLKNIRNKWKENSEISELRYLKEKCISFDPLVSETASGAIFLLVMDGIINVDSIVAEIITAIPTARCFSSLASLLTRLMKLQYSRNKSHLNYSLSEPQHPFITMLNGNSSTQECIFNEIKYFAGTENDGSITEIFLPVFLYSICNPTSNSIPVLKQRLWSHLIKNSDVFDKELVFLLLCWMQIDSSVNIELNSGLLNEASVDWQVEDFKSQEILVLWQCSVLHNLMIKRCNVRPTLFNFWKNIDKYSNHRLQFIDPIMLILGKTIRECLPTYLEDCLEVCRYIISMKENKNFSLQVIKMVLLPWITAPSVLTNKAESMATDLLEYIDTYEQNAAESYLESALTRYKSVLCCNNDIYIAIKFNITIHKKQNLSEWLDNVALAPVFLLKYIFPYLGGIFIDSTASQQVAHKSFKLLLKCLTTSKHLASEILTLILYKLSNVYDSELMYDLLTALPSMVVLKENIPKVAATIQAISQNSTVMENFSIKLMLDAWKLDNKCYPYLESMVLGDINYNTSGWETNVTKAYVLKELCEHRPELHGKELVAHLSKILNQSTSHDELACALAIEGITILCRVEIIDVVTTWATLAPKFKEDNRIPVVKSLCKLIREIPLLPYTEAYSELIKEVVEILWFYINTSQNEEVIKAALNALVTFKLEDICSKIPSEFLNQKILEEQIKTTGESVLVLPGVSWVSFLNKCKSMEAASEFIIKMVSREISAYFKYVYHVKGSREPPNYNGLPAHSIVKELGSFVKENHHNWKNWDKKKVYVECLRILSQEFSKPLPPFDWCFLQELIHEPEIKYHCVCIACHQVILSGSARRLIDNYILAISEIPKEADILSIFQNLKHIANSIQPITLAPFLKASFEFVISSNEITNTKLLNTILDHLKQVLQNKNIQDINKETIAQAIQEIIWKLPSSSKVFDVLLDCLIYVPQKHIDELITINESLPTEILEKVSKIRFAIAKGSDHMSMNCLNDIIQIRTKIDRNFFHFDDLIKVFKSQINNTESALWVLEIFGQIQVKVADRCDKREITYYCDILMTSVVVFSGFFIFLNDDSELFEDIKELFPVALATLLKVDHWSICTIQVLEWLYHMNFEEVIPTEYKRIFKHALCNLRDNDEFSKNMRWMKYLNCNIER